MAEALALLCGLQLCRDHNLNHVEIETDSQILLRLLNSNQPWPWSIFVILKEAKFFLSQVSSTFRHVYREVNTVADLLANMAATNCFSQTFSGLTIPQYCKGLVRLDQLGYPSVRTRFCRMQYFFLGVMVYALLLCISSH